jgi:hypothetical protein
MGETVVEFHSMATQDGQPFLLGKEARFQLKCRKGEPQGRLARLGKEKK